MVVRCKAHRREPLVVSQEVLRGAEGVHEACKILFGEEADAKYAEYFASSA